MCVSAIPAEMWLIREQSADTAVREPKGASVILLHVFKLIGTDCVGAVLRRPWQPEHDELYPGDTHKAVVGSKTAG